MSERYVKLFALPENLYTSGSPVVIAAGALLKDNQTGKVLAQLKLRNIGAKSIKAAKVSVCPLDTVGNPLGAEFEYQYLDLNVNRDGEFGAKSPVFLTDAATRSFAASATEVIFSDNTVWQSQAEPWESLSAPVTLYDVLMDQELVKQYRLKFGGDCKYEPLIQKDLWYCTCGELNHKEETSCYQCKRTVSSLLSVDMDALKQDRDIRIAAEQKKAAEEKATADIKAKRTKKKVMIISAIIILLIAAVSVFYVVKANKEEALRLEAYNAAVELLNSERYEEAIEAFAALGDYKDSAEKKQSAEKIQYETVCQEKYSNAVALYEAEEYEEARAIFGEIYDYLDSKEYITSCDTRIYLRNEKEQAIENFSGRWCWGTVENANNMYLYEYNPYDQFYVDFETNTITQIFSSSTTQYEKVNSFRIVNATVLETNSFRCNNGTAAVYWHFIDGEVIVSFHSEASGKQKMPMVRIGE